MSPASRRSAERRAHDELRAAAGAELPDLIETLDCGPPSSTKAADPPAPLRLSHYELVERLGGGGAGVVYRAIDRRTEQVVALKLLHPSALSEERTVLRFRREFRSVSRLDHPNCVRVLEEGTDGTHRFFTMEHVAGGDMRRLIGAPRDVVLAALVQVAGALDYIHGRRIVHRDLKPANVLLTLDETPRPKLADFGIALDALQPRVTHAGMLVGTLAYLSPEQLHGEPIDPRTDLYALGCMCWELIAGSPPRRPHDVLDAVTRPPHRMGRLGEHAAEVPAALDELVAALLAPAPEDRPGSALEVMHALVEVLAAGAPEMAERLLARVTASSAQSSGKSFLYQPALIGRGAELARLHELGQQVGDGGRTVPTLAVLRGPPGLGKSLLAAQAVTELSRAGVHTVVARIEPVGEPLAALRAIASAVDRWKPRSGGGQLLSGVRLDQLRSLAGSVWDVGAVGKATEPGAVQRRRAEQLAERLLAIAAIDRFAVVIEDLHDADAGTRALLASVLDRLRDSDGPRPLLLATTRPRGAEFLEGRDDVEWMDLAVLDAAGVRRLCAGLLGVGESGVPPALAAHAAAICDGNPLAVRSFVHRLADAGALQRIAGGWRAEASAMREAVADQLDRLLAQLSASTRALLARAALVGGAFDVELLCRAFARSPEQVMDAVDEALRASIVRGSEAPAHLDAYRFDHARFGEALAASLSAEARREAHQRIGHALASRGEAAAVVAHHLHLGGDARAAFAAARAAAERARQMHDLDAATRYFRWALEHADAGGASAEERAACSEGLADALATSGHGAEAALVLRAIPDDAASSSATRRQRKLGHALVLAGEVQPGIAELQGTLRGGGPSSMPARLLRIGYDLTLARLRRLMGRGPSPSPQLEAAALAHRELALLHRWIDLYGGARHVAAYLRCAERHGDASLRVDALAMYQVLLQWQGRARRSAAVAEEARALAATLTDPSAQAQLAVVQGLSRVLHNDLEGAIARWSEAADHARRAGDRARHCLAISSRGWARVYRGEFDAALLEFEHAQRIVGGELPWYFAEAAAGRAYAEVWSGKLEAAVARADEVRREAARMGLPALVAVAGEVRAWRHYLRGEMSIACDELASALALYRRHHLGRAWGYAAQFGYVDSLLWELDAGRRDRRATVAAIAEVARHVARELSALPMFRGLSDVLWGITWARRGKRGKAERCFQRAEAARGGRSLWDAWLTGRVAVERHRLGLSPERVALARDSLRRDAVIFGAGIEVAVARFVEALR